MSLTKDQLFALIGANVPDNTSGLITPTKMREVLTQTADSMLFAAKGVREVELLRATSTTTQQPSTTNTPIVLSFGVAQKAVTDPVMINSSGLVTFNQAGSYAIRVSLRFGRTGGVGTSIMAARIRINGAQAGFVDAIKLESAEVYIPYESRSPGVMNAGDTLDVQIIRDSAGHNSGGVFTQAVTAAGWGPSPSCAIVVSRLEPVP